MFATVSGIGGDRGWYVAGPLWTLRGWIDKVIGGVGMRRGRRHPDRLRVGDALDFFRVEAYAPPRLLRLRVYYDGSAVPSVDAPVGDFFAVGNGFEGEVESLMVRNSSAGRARNCYWPMPFRKSCKVTVTNEGRRRVSMLYFHVDWNKVPSLPAHTPYFHARYRQSLPALADGSNYEFLNVNGRGHYVGTVMSVVQAEAGWFGEGDDFFWVDGEKYPSVEGTGSEDYVGLSWGMQQTPFLYNGCSEKSFCRWRDAKFSFFEVRRSPPEPFTHRTSTGSLVIESSMAILEEVLPPPVFVIRWSEPSRFDR